MRLDGPLLLVGCGKMGGALLTGWLEQGLAAAQVLIVEPFDAAREALAAKGMVCATHLDELDEAVAPAVVVLAVKPQHMTDALPVYRRLALSLIHI